ALVAIRLGPLDHLLATPAPIDVDQGSGGDQMPKAVARLWILLCGLNGPLEGRSRADIAPPSRYSRATPCGDASPRAHRESIVRADCSHRSMSHHPTRTSSRRLRHSSELRVRRRAVNPRSYLLQPLRP